MGRRSSLAPVWTGIGLKWEQGIQTLALAYKLDKECIHKYISTILHFILDKPLNSF